jgi:Phosphodiester glycosidase
MRGYVLAAAALFGGAISSASADQQRLQQTLGPIAVSAPNVATSGGTRPFHMIRFPPGTGVRLEAVWLGGGPGRTRTVGAYVTANKARGAIGGLNGDFFLLARKVPSGNLFLHKGRSFLGNTERGAAVFAADGGVDIRPGDVKASTLLGEGQREATSGKPVYVNNGRIGFLGTLEPYQRNPAYQRSAVGRMANGDTALITVGGAGLPAKAFAQGLIKLGIVEALGMDIDSSANLNWRGASLNRPGYQRSIPTGIIVFRTP